MFVDKVKILVKGGNGGHGVVAWRREKFEPAGGPAGGDGGFGGNVILIVDEGVNTLVDFKYKRKFFAQNGEDGRTKRQFGKKGEDLFIKVPPGTLVKDDESGRIIADLKNHNDTFLVAKGGRGGRGNAKFTTSTRQAPNFAEGGTKVNERHVTLELKLLADVGLVGFPNVGKSTLLSTVSAASPKIANYHFTTLKPQLGVVRIADEKSFVMADIPGLIEGAHLGIGLGHEFLRHIERTKLIVHIIDVSRQDGRDPIEDFYKINEELVKYNPKLAQREQIVVANKMDIPNSEEEFLRLKEEIINKGYEIHSISAATRKGIEELKYIIWNKLQTIGEVDPIFEIEEDVIFELDNKDKQEFNVYVENGKYIVDGDKVEKLLDSTNFDDFDSMRFFQKRIRDMGIVDKLRELGITEDDTVDMCGYEFDFTE